MQREPVVFEPDGREWAALWMLEGDTLHVLLGGYVKSTPLRGSVPDVLAHVLLGALLDELEAAGIDVTALGEEV